MIKVIHEHSVDTDILEWDSNVLDIGCRGFDFCDSLNSNNVFCIDIDDLRVEHLYYRLAISDANGMTGVNHTNDKQATHIKEGNEIPMMTIPAFSKMVGVEKWDLIKMDIEGEEVKVLKSLSHPYCKQISVEFHAHCGVQTKESLDSLLDWLSEWYAIHNRVWESRHGAGFNYWDILLIAK